MTGRGRIVLPAALFAALVLAAFADPVFTRRTFVGRDIVPYNLPLEKAVHDAWARGRVPVWWEEISGGRPLMPNPNAGVFYPIRPLLAPLSFPTAMRLFPVLHWILAGWGMLLALRAIASPAAAWVGATSYVFSGVVVSEVFYTNFLPGACLLPWALWAVARPAARTIGRALPVAVVFALMLLAGDAFSVALALLAAALWLALECSAGERVRLAVGIGVGVAAAVLVALPQIVATALLAPETRRGISGVPLAEALIFTLSPWRLLELVVPYPFGPTWSLDLSIDWGSRVGRQFFASLFVAPIAVWALFARPVGAAGARAARGLVAVGVVLATAGALVPASWRHFASPVPLRYPEKFMLGATLGLAILAALGFEALRRGARTRVFLAAAGGLAAAALAVRLFSDPASRAFVRAVGGAPALAPAAAASLPGALAAAGLCWIATAAAARLARPAGAAASVAALALLTAVSVAANRPIARSSDQAAVFPPTAFARAIERRDPEGRFRAVDESIYRAPSPLGDVALNGDPGGSEFYRQAWSFYTPSLWRRGLVLNNDFDAGDLSRVESLRRVATLAATQRDSAPFFSSLALRFGLRYRDQDPLPGYSRFRGGPFWSWDENAAALPDVRLATQWVEAAGPLEALSALPHLAAGGIVVESGRAASGSARPGRVRFLERSPERLVLETDCPDPSWLFVLRGDWSYRTVTIDGRPGDVLPAQIAFAAVPLPAGAHRVAWSETVPGIALSAWGPAAGALLLAAVFLRRPA